MPFNPTLPADHSPLVAAQMRSQLNGLNDLIALNFTNATNYTNGVLAGTSSNSNGVATLGLSVSNPPQQSEVQAIADKLDELINALRR